MKPTVLRLNTHLLSPQKHTLHQQHYMSTQLDLNMYLERNTEQLHQTHHSKSVFHH